MLIGWLTQTVTSLLMGPLAAAKGAGAAPQARLQGRPRWSRDRMRLLFWKLRRAYELAVGSGALGELQVVLRRLTEASVGVTELLLAWIDLVETIIQQSEAEFSSRAGSGALKKAYTKAVLIEVISRSRAAKAAPDLFTPWLIWAAVDVVIDAVVRLINDRDLWHADGPASAKPRASWLGGLVRRLILGFLNLVARFYTWGLRRTQLTPAVQRAVDQVLADHPIDPLRLFDGVGDLVDWLGDHRREVVAVTDLIAAAAEEAERFGTLSGPEKQAYARDLIVAFVEVEFGADYARALDSPLARMILDGLINAVVLVLRKRGEFRPDEPRTPPAASLGVRQDRVREEIPKARFRASA